MIPVVKLDTNEVNVTPTNSVLIKKLTPEEVTGKVEIKEGQKAIFQRAERELPPWIQQCPVGPIVSVSGWLVH